MDSTVVVAKDGKEKLRLPAKTLADGTIRVKVGPKWMPVTNADACAALGLDPVTVARSAAPAEALARMGDNGYGMYVYPAAEWDSIAARQRADKQAELEVAVPGVKEAIRLSEAAQIERERYSHAFDRMMEDEDNDGARPPKPEDKTITQALSAHLASHPRAALYLKAKHQSEGAHWADNTGTGSAGTRAMEILASGGTIEEAEAALAVRREFTMD